MEDIKYKGYTIEINENEDISYCDSPREWGTLSKIVAFHNNYTFPIETKEAITSGDFDSWDELKKYLYKHEDILSIYPIYMYDHSGITWSMGKNYPYNDGWDSGQVGYIYLSREDVREWYNVKKITKEIKRRAEETLRDEFKLYNQYIEGDIYSYTIKREVKSWSMDGTEYANEDIIDSLCGIYGYEEAEEEAKAYIDSIKQ